MGNKSLEEQIAILNAQLRTYIQSAIEEQDLAADGGLDPEVLSCLDCETFRGAQRNEPFVSLCENIRVLVDHLEERHRQATELAMRDTLTGLYNRRYLEDIAPRELERMRRQGNPVAIFTADLDGLKEINDSLGHHSGDRALVAFSELLAGAIRSSDLAIRAGGDEFIALLFDAEETDVAMIAARLRRNLERFNNVGHETFRLAASVGYALWRPAEPLLQAVERADARMYTQKHRRRLSGAMPAVAPAPMWPRRVGDESNPC